MRIALRTSGGRGEYELAGSHDGIDVHDVIEQELYLQVYPGLIYKTNNVVRHAQGKPRIRLNNRRTDRHVYRLLADILLLPSPIRELAKTATGLIQLTEKNYSISSIQLDIISSGDSRLLIQPTQIIIENAEHDMGRIDFTERLRVIMDLWLRASIGTDSLSDMLRKHRKSVLDRNTDTLIKVTQSIRNHFDIDDPLHESLRHFSMISMQNFGLGLHRDDLESNIEDNDDTPLKASTQLRLKKWRTVAERGADGKKFRTNVKRAYNNTCLFTGYYLPKSSCNDIPGVDSAHILPWADYELNDVCNGLCLNKLCHWAFDAGILILGYNYSAQTYHLRLSRNAKRAERHKEISLTAFHSLEGEIPSNRLPQDTKCWPSPEFLSRYAAMIED